MKVGDEVVWNGNLFGDNIEVPSEIANSIGVITDIVEEDYKYPVYVHFYNGYIDTFHYDELDVVNGTV